MLAGVKVYLLPMRDAPATAAASKTGELAQLSRKQQKRLEKSKQEPQGAPDSISMYFTDTNYIKGLLYYSLFDGVVGHPLSLLPPAILAMHIAQEEHHCSPAAALCPSPVMGAVQPQHCL
jgi:hypothetical protein